VTKSRKPTTSHVFTVLFRVRDASEPGEYAARAYDSAVLGDVLLGGPDPAGILDADFERQGKSFPRTVLDALNDVQDAFPEAEILRVEPDDLVTVAAIADRVGRSHESVRLLTRNKRGPGGFPPPAGNLDAKTQAWRWSEVARWFRDAMGVDSPGPPNAAFLAALNDILDLRRVAGEAIDGPRTARALASLLPKNLAVRA